MLACESNDSVGNAILQPLDLAQQILQLDFAVLQLVPLGGDGIGGFDCRVRIAYSVK